MPLRLTGIIDLNLIGISGRSLLSAPKGWVPSTCGGSTPGSAVRLGLFRPKSHEIVEVTTCTAHHPAINRALEVGFGESGKQLAPFGRLPFKTARLLKISRWVVFFGAFHFGQVIKSLIGTSGKVKGYQESDGTGQAGLFSFSFWGACHGRPFQGPKQFFLPVFSFSSKWNTVHAAN